MVSPPWMMCCCCCFAGGADDCSSSKSKWKSLWWLFIASHEMRVFSCAVFFFSCFGSLMPFCGTKWKRNEAFESSRGLIVCCLRMGHTVTSNSVTFDTIAACNIATSRGAAFLPKVTYAHNDRVGKIASLPGYGGHCREGSQVVVRRAILKFRNATKAHKHHFWLK